MKAKRKNILKAVLFIELLIVLILLAIFIVKGIFAKEQGNDNASMVTNGDAGTLEEAENNKYNTVLGPATYTIEVMQETLTGKEGETLAVISYEKPVLDGNSQTIKKINQSISDDYTLFYKNKDNLFAYAQGDYDANGYGYFNNEAYINTCECEVTDNNTSSISFKMSTKWFAGGVSNKDFYGLTYSLETGETLGLEDIFIETSSEVKDKIMTASKEYVNNHPDIGWVDNVMDIIENKKISEYKYYLVKDKVYIIYDTYELAAGASGAQIIEVDIN